MAFDFSDLQKLFSVAPGGTELSRPLNDGVAERIRQILNSGGPDERRVDLPPLIRHVLLREGHRRGSSAQIRLPGGNGWPDEVVWKLHSIRTYRIAGDLLLEAESWTPSWLDRSEGDVFSDAFSETEVRVDGRCPADPFIVDATGFDTYSCPGQREAVRAAFLMPPGETLIVNLPTGAGKSLAGYAPALTARQDGHLTVFIVPTVALAVDQERQLQRFLRKRGQQTYPLAWHGGTPADARSQIRQRLRSGSQRILFTSPEAVTGSLLGQVTDSARAGWLRYLVIDEAHLVSQWGDEFRPAFQALSGLRNSLLRVAPKGHESRTLLLSATFTEETIATLSTLFGPVDVVQNISAVHVRPEPQYWFYGAASLEEKRERSTEALRHAPRPFILYVTKRADARQWERVLSELGMKRFKRYDGEISGRPDVSREILTSWAENKLDGIVATSAFGVGIDKEDVRTVIHATIPETLDRFYQEVGRGGRDGRPSISLLIFEKNDWSLPRRLATPKIVSDEVGLERWQAMFQGGLVVSEELVEVDLKAIRLGLTGDNDYNVAWNLRTLLLLCRAGVIELDVSPYSQTDQDVEPTGSTPTARVWVRIKDYSHMQAATWARKVQPARERSARAGLWSFDLMKKLVGGRHEVSDILANLYTIRTETHEINVARSCGGCPLHRGPSERLLGYQPPLPAPLARVEASANLGWGETFPDLPQSLVFVFYEGSSMTAVIKSKMLDFVGWLVGSCGITEVAVRVGSELLTTVGWRGLYKRAERGILLHRDIDDGQYEPYSPLPRVTVYDRPLEGDMLACARRLVRPFHVILLPSETRDPGNDGKRLIETTLMGARLNDLLQRLTQ
jgi:ATP-dependent DNA helicase RecQ